MKTNIPICLNSKGGRCGILGLQPSINDRVYSVDGIACCIATSVFFNPEIIIKGKKNNENKIIIEIFYKSREPRIYKSLSPCLRAERLGLLILE